jgi:hypothetical protein
MYYPQYGQDEKLERLGVPFPILPGTDQFGRIERRALITRNISIYTNKFFRVSTDKERAFIDAHVWQTVIPKNLDVYQLSINIGKERVRQGDSHNTDNQPYKCIPVGVPDVNNRMARHVELIRLECVLHGVLSCKESNVARLLW